MENMKELQGFLDHNNHLTALPARQKKRLFALHFLASFFEAAKSYTEKEVNALLNQHCTFQDPATLRREMFNNGFLDRTRDGSSYQLNPKHPTLLDLRNSK